MTRVLKLIVVLLTVCVGSTYAQRQMLSPEQRTLQLKDSLDLSEEQSAGVFAIFQQLETERKAIFESSAEDRQARMQAMRSLGERADTQIEELLTTGQKAKYAEMKKRRQERMGGMRRRD